MNGGSPLIELRDFWYTYLAGTPRAAEAVRGVSLSIDQGERVAILGSSRSGKSTLVHSFAHLLRLTPGQVFFEGRDIAAPDFDRSALRRQVGIVFQDAESQIIEDVAGKDVAFGPTASGVPADETRQRVEDSLNAVGLPYREFRLRYVHAMSGGERRRLAIAGVLAMRTRVLVLDEPTAGLDPAGRSELVEELAALVSNRDVTLIVCSASLRDAVLLCERAVVLDGGRVVLDDTLRGIARSADRLRDLDIALPEAMEIAAELRTLFPGFPTDTLTPIEVESALRTRLGV